MFGNDNEPKILSESEIMEFKKKHGIVLFYMNGCGHCETMKPAWNKVITELKEKHKNEIILGAVESGSMDMFKKHGINPSVSGFPTILYFHPKKHNAPEYYKGDRSYEDLKKWILTKKGKGKSKSDTPTPLLILTDADKNKNKNTNNNHNDMGNKSKGYAFSQSGGGSTKKRRRIKRKSHKRRKTSVRRKSRRHRGHSRR